MTNESVGYVCPLHARELEAVSLAAADKSVKESARIMGISPRTVTHYLTDAKNRLGPRTIAGLVALVIRKGWLQ